MAIDVTTIGLAVDSSKLKQGTRELDNFGKSADKASRGADKFNADAEKLGKTSSVAAGLVGKLGLALGAVVGVGSLVRTVDEYTKFTAQLKLATNSQEQFNTAINDVSRIARVSQSDISSVATLYARLNNALKDVGVSQAQVARITENVGLALKVSGATASESASAILQLSQAFGSGVLRGEEFNAVNEAAPALMRALAESIGVPVGALRELASNGQITADVLNKAFGDEKLLEKFRAQAKEVNTLSGAFTVLMNEVKGASAEFLQGSGSVTIMTTALTALADAIGSLRRNLSGQEIKEFFARLTPAGGILTDVAKTVSVIRNNRRIATGQRDPSIRNPNSIGGALAITSNGNIAPNFGAGYEVGDINEIHRRQNEVARANKEAYDKAKELREKATKETNLAEVRRLNVAIGINEQIYAQEQTLMKERQEQQEKYMKWQQDVANENYREAQEKFKRAEEEKAREFEKTIDGINQTFREGFASLINGGKGSWKSFTQSLFTTFKTTVADSIYKLFAQPFVVKLVASILGGGASGTASAGVIDSLTGGDGRSLLGTIKDGFDSLNSDFVGSIEKLGTFLSTGQGGLGDTIGGFLGEYSSQIAGALSFAPAVFSLLKGDVKGAALQGGGAAIGTFLGGPVGGAIGSFIGGALGSLFGGEKLPPRYSSGQFTTLKNGEIGVDRQIQTGYKSAGGNDALSRLNKQFLTSLDTLLNAFGQRTTIATSSSLDNKLSAASSFNVKVGSAATFGTGEIKQKDADLNTVYKLLVEKALGSVLVEAIKKSTLSTDIKALFNGFTKKEDVANMINAVINLKNANDGLADRFGITTNEAAQVAKQTGLAGQELIKFINEFAALGGSFNSIGKQLIAVRTGLESVYGGVLPADLKAFDAALKAIDTTTKAGIESFTELFLLRGQFEQFSNAISGLKMNVRSALYSMVSESEKRAMQQEDLAKVFNELGYAVPASVQELIALGKSIDYTTEQGLNLASVFPTLVDAFNQTQEAANALVASLTTDKFKSLFEFQRAQAYVGQGLSLADIPSYDVGTSYVPQTGLAMLHQGERVMTAQENKAYSNSGDMSGQIGELRAEIQSIAVNASKMYKVLYRLESDGFLIREVGQDGNPQIIPVTVV